MRRGSRCSSGCGSRTVSWSRAREAPAETRVRRRSPPPTRSISAPADEVEIDGKALRKRRDALRPAPYPERHHAQQRLVVGADTEPFDDLEAVALGKVEALANRHRRELLARELRLRREQSPSAVAVPMRVEEETRIAVPQRGRKEGHRLVPQRRLRVEKEAERRDEIEPPAFEHGGIRRRIAVHERRRVDAAAGGRQHRVRDIEADGSFEMPLDVGEHAPGAAREIEAALTPDHVLLEDVVDQTLLALPDRRIERAGGEEPRIVILCPRVGPDVRGSVVL